MSSRSSNIPLLLLLFLYSLNFVQCSKQQMQNQQQFSSSFEKLQKLRTEMQKFQISAYIIPSSDSHLSEYVSSSDKRREFISGFDGSAGTVVVTNDSALLWTDGRYWKQAENQLDLKYWKLMKSDVDGSLVNWLTENVKGNQSVGVDPFLYSVNEFRSLQKSSVSVKLIYQNLVDLIWANRPPAPNGTIFDLDLKFSGQSTADKLSTIRNSMISKKVDCYIVTALDEIAWFLNLRGSDIEYNTVFNSYLIFTMNDVKFHVDQSKIKDSQIFDRLRGLNIQIRPYSSYIEDVIEITQQQQELTTTFIDPAYCNYATYSSIKSERIVEGTSFIRFEKAVKNQVERDGFRQCHVRDGLAVVRYLAWLENELKNGRKVNEFEGSEKVEEFRALGEHFIRPSFETISAYGENAAIIHYSPNRNNHADIRMDNVYLLDSGGQYLDGTTDITRTVHFGIPSERVKRSFTRVLQGQLALSSLTFPLGMTGDKMEPIARFALWKDGLDYNHGSGHGVGHCLDVHEGPHGIGVPGYGFKEHYDVTIEPGYYEIGAFGIRLENLYLVRRSQQLLTSNNFENRTFLEFEQITYCPIQPSLVDVSVLSDREIQAIDEYNQLVLEKLKPLLSNDLLAMSYLERNTKKINPGNESSISVTLLTIALVMVIVVLVISVAANIYFMLKLKKQQKQQVGGNESGELQALSTEEGY